MNVLTKIMSWWYKKCIYFTRSSHVSIPYYASETPLE